ncbi:ADP-ribosylation factor-binding protein GGA1 isoform X2 [Ochotona curzoniae]|uniref:ADP-ribosylation factor-binding protein GGA1 isoform X2 n=1 Tax=Ochotona curzoniae TaxID=130825 RepID=UPI001B34A682|nr:ADP-ribosylation factor-binding protein GGA1 isoform X2 [Ochotona curzoniae]
MEEPAMEPETLEARINQATNPLNKELNWASINGFCEQLNEDFEGPPLATRLLAHKIQSPQEWEAMQALTVLETCMKSCGKRFHDEVGKFRFLNELIKVVSPKYLGSRTSEKVKSKILELLYSWTVGLPEEVKIAEAYQMLKKQGIVRADPKLPEDALFSLPPPRPKNVIFEDEEKSKMLARLLKSSHPEDLRAANKLIKEMVQEDQKRMEKISKRVNAIEEVNNNVKLLTEMVMNHSQGGASGSSEDLMKELYQRCERMRPTLFRLASDTEDNDEALAEILQANDNLTQVINLYKQLVRGEEVNGDTTASAVPGSTSALLDLSGLDLPTGTTHPAVPSCPGGQASPESLSTSVSLLDDELMSLGLSDPTPPAGPSLEGAGWNSFQSSESAEHPTPTQAQAASTNSRPVVAQTALLPPPPPSSSGLDDLDLLGKTLLQQSLPPESQQKQQPAPRLTLRDLQTKNSGSSPSLGAASLLPTTSPEPPAPSQQPTPPELSLANITVPLESIKPSSILPVTVYDQHGFRVLFHFARDPLPGRSDLLVVVVSMLSTAPQPIRNIVFQSAVPKVMKVKLQPPSGTELPAFNPIVHPSAITQVLLLANPQKEKVRLRYKLIFTMGEQTYNEMGDVDQFPPPDTWGSL